VLTERLVPEGIWYLARAGRLSFDIHGTNHDSCKVDIVDLFKCVDISYNRNTDVVGRGDIRFSTTIKLFLSSASNKNSNTQEILAMRVAEIPAVSDDQKYPPRLTIPQVI
jgi:hypothetical protein